MKGPPRLVGIGLAAWGAWFFVAIAALALVSCVAVIAGTARAQHAGHAENHDWYRGLLTPSGHSCCNGDTPEKRGDCRPVQARPTDDGGWEAFFGGEWRPIPPERILPDRLNRVPLSAHLCEQDGDVRCFLRGGGGT